ncbi:hypothetical protein ACIG8S_04090 [[Kitasatospora] papulosa]|uniref:hypothetical protein n=1 Tax=[Kitasatospora] papulosa TaxID=1464011 RepID=UPI0037CDD2A1
MGSGTVFAHGSMCNMEEIRDRVQAAAKKRARAKDAFTRADAELRDLLVTARTEDIGPSELARLTGLTREWVAKIAPDPDAKPRRTVKVPKGTLDRVRGTDSD